MEQTEPGQAEGAARAAAISTALTPEAVLARLGTASRRGRLPGFRTSGAGWGEDGMFSVSVFGRPFDEALVGISEPAEDGTRLRFHRRLHWKLPAAFAAILIATVWPGVYLMDQLIPGEWGWVPTWWWYIPLTALPIPWVWRGVMRRSHAAAERSARETIARIAAELDGRAE